MTLEGDGRSMATYTVLRHFIWRPYEGWKISELRTEYPIGKLWFYQKSIDPSVSMTDQQLCDELTFIRLDNEAKFNAEQAECLAEWTARDKEAKS